jgi:hypothetical protein
MKFDISEKPIELARKNAYCLVVKFSDSEDTYEFDEEYEDLKVKEIIIPRSSDENYFITRLISFFAITKLLAFHDGEFELTAKDSRLYELDMDDLYNDKYFPACSYGQNGVSGTPMSWELFFYGNNGDKYLVKIKDPEDTHYDKYELEEDEE